VLSYTSAKAFRRKTLPKTFHDLDVWNKAIDLTMLIYEAPAIFPKHEIYGLTSQMRRAAVSIPSNVAEGSARGTRRDFRQFVKQAEGSNCELQTQLTIAKRLLLRDPTQLDAAEVLSLDIGKMLGGLSAYLAREVQAQRSTQPAVDY
jgi:four helix bundle protein